MLEKITNRIRTKSVQPFTRQSQSYITTDSQSETRDFFFLKVTVLSFGGALSDERSGLSFISPCQYSLQWSVSIYINYLQSVLNTFHIYNI
jgi:hypothetical protein